MNKGKKRLRAMSYEDYGISPYRYRELKAFCRQYREKKDRIQYGLSAVIQDGQPHGKSVGNPTERQAIENQRYSEDVHMIEDAAKRANPDIAEYILRSVTDGLTYEQICDHYHIKRYALDRTDFYAYRRRFFGILNDLRITKENKSGYA